MLHGNGINYHQKLCHPLLFHCLKEPVILFYLINCIVYIYFFFLGFYFCRVHTFALAISYLCILCLVHELLLKKKKKVVFKVAFSLLIAFSEGFAIEKVRGMSLQYHHRISQQR